MSGMALVSSGQKPRLEGTPRVQGAVPLRPAGGVQSTVCGRLRLALNYAPQTQFEVRPIGTRPVCFPPPSGAPNWGSMNRRH